MYYDKEELLFRIRMIIEDIHNYRYARELKRFNFLQMAAVMNNPQKQFKELKIHRSEMSKKLYVMYLRMFYKNSIQGVEINTVLDAFKRISKRDIMDRKEMKAYRLLPDTVTIYRRAHKNEYPLRLSWTLHHSIVY
mgnify:CR=1 FL=1